MSRSIARARAPGTAASQGIRATQRPHAARAYLDTPDCAAPGVTPQLIPTVGDFRVTDAPSVPTTKDQCKDGGWTRYGARFKNQGRCVAFVERGPKPSPRPGNQS